VRGVRPESLEYAGPAESLVDVWIALRASLRSVLDAVTLADIAAGTLPDVVRAAVADPANWEPR
jgi:DNA-binding IscR family transcriptional regulator